MRLLFVIHTYHRGKYLLLDLPLLILNKNSNNPELDKITMLKLIMGNPCNEALADIFSKKNSFNFNQVFDLTIESDRYISYPIWLEGNKYLNYKNTRLINDGIYEDISGDEEENMKKILNIEEKNKMVKLKMFNIVLIIERDSDNNHFLKNINTIYKILESLSNHLAFEEYRGNYLAHEIHLILRLLEKIGYTENINDIIKQGYDSISNKIDTFLKNINDNNLFKILKKFFEDLNNLKNHNFLKLNINNLIDLKIPLKIYEPDIEIENHQTLLLVKKKQISDNFMNSNDINPLIKIFLEISTPFKNFREISLEYKLPLDFIKSIAKQIHCMNLGYICNKFTNNTIFTVNPNMKFKFKLETDIENHFKIKDFYDFINKFIDLKPLNKIFKENSNNFTNENFLSLIDYLAANEFLIPCSKYIIPKMPLRKKYNQFLEYLYKSDLFFKKTESYKSFLNDFDAYNTIEKEENININLFSSKKEIFLEDILLKIKKIKESDYNILNDIYYFLNTDFDFDQITSLSIYKDDEINSTIKKYKYLFNIVIEPIMY